MKIHITVRDKVGKDFISQEIKYINNAMEVDLERIAKRCETILRYMIDNKTEGGTGKLANADGWTAEKITGGWGVGDIQKLNKEVNYWRHCLCPNTEVYAEINDKIIPIKLYKLFDFWKNNNNIKILSPNGLKKINHMWIIPLDNYYSFNISNWFSVNMSGNHKLIYKLNGRFIEKQAKSFGSSYYAYSTLFSTLKSANDKIIDNVNINGYIIKLDFLLGWMLGMILAEGTFSKTGNKITIPQKNIDKIACYVTEFCRTFDYLPCVYNYKTQCSTVVVSHDKINDIIKFFIKGKSYNKQFINLFLNSPIEFREGILEGYDLGDGRQSCINNNEIRTTSELLRNQLLLIGSSLGFDCSLWKDQWNSCATSYKSTHFIKGGNLFNHCRNYNVKQNICKKIGKDKKNRRRGKNGQILPQEYKKVDFTYFPKTVTNIVKIQKKVNFIDLQVDGELFLINGGIVSHNSNYGSVAIGANWEHYLPKGFWVNGRWVVSEKGFSGQKPRTPIEGLNYIESTIAHMESEITKILKG